MMMKTKQPVIPVILAGGKGSRLWPLSNDTCPKQFRSINGTVSFFQSTVKRVADREIYQRPLVLISQEYHRTATRQLREIDGQDARIVLEPEGRDTAPAIVIAALLARASLPAGQEGYLLVMPSDHVLECPSAFHMAVQAALGTSISAERLWALGVPPLYPETGYGYLRLGASLGKSAFEVECFVEKPGKSRAEEFITSGKFVWNSGIFLFPISLLLRELEIHFPDMLSTCSRAVMEASISPNAVCPDPTAWSTLTSTSIDYALMERSKCVGAILTDPGWSDLGDWQSWWAASDKDDRGNAIEGPSAVHECDNILLHSDGPIVATLGIENLAIVVNEDAVLVAPLARAKEIKEMTAHISGLSRLSKTNAKAREKAGFEERPWGRFDCLQKGKGYQVKLITVNPGGTLSLQYHHYRSEHWTVVAGVADVHVDGQEFQLKLDQSTFIPQMAVHRLSNNGTVPVELIEVQCGGYLGEDDIVRLDDCYGRSSSEPSKVPGTGQDQFVMDFTGK